MSWNHRIIKTEAAEGLQVHEVYYDSDGDILYWTATGITPYGETPKALKDELARMQAAFLKPILEEITINNHTTLRVLDKE